jgi:peptide/nickel transport system ATP-binding protein
MTDLLQVANLSLAFGRSNPIPILEDVSFQIAPGEALAIVGESGSGKSMTALSLIRLLPAGAVVDADDIRLGDTDLLHASEKQMDAVRGRKIGVLFQQPKRMLDPTSTVGTHLAEPLRRSLGLSRSAVHEASVALLRDVGIPEPERRLRSYAHQLSGGMAQRVMIAIALAGRPSLLIADEPTTALDVTVEAQILKLIAAKRAELGMSLLYISHDLKVVADVADRIAVMYAGRIVEEGPAEEIVNRPKHPYTHALIECSLLRPRPTGELYSIPGSALAARRFTEGCRFRDRCTLAAELHIFDHCAAAEPTLTTIPGQRPDHLSRCWGTLEGYSLQAAPITEKESA